MEAVKNRYMFDTCALNQIAESPKEEMLIYQSKSKGYEYYFTEIQVIEAHKNILKEHKGVPKELVERSRAEFAVKLLSIMVKLQTKYVGQIATLRPNRWILDGTFTFLPEDERASADAFMLVLKNNDWQHYNDAMIAMTAVSNGCCIVSNDNDFFKKFNRVVPGRFIRYEEFLPLLT